MTVSIRVLLSPFRINVPFQQDLGSTGANFHERERSKSLGIASPVPLILGVIQKLQKKISRATRHLFQTGC